MSRSVIFIFGVFIVYLLIRWLSQRASVTVPTAFASNPKKDIPTQETLPISHYPVMSILGGKRVNVSRLIKIIIRGKSLAKFGVNDKSLVYVSPQKFNNDKYSLENLKKLIGRIIILQIDNVRTVQEHPFDENFFRSDGLKARKVISILNTKLGKDELMRLLPFLNEPNIEFPENITEFKEKIYKKYKFASDFYSEDEYLIMSMTYRKDGNQLGFSFHSPKFVFGVVEYVVPPKELKESNENPAIFNSYN